MYVKTQNHTMFLSNLLSTMIYEQVTSPMVKICKYLTTRHYDLKKKPIKKQDISTQMTHWLQLPLYRHPIQTLWRVTKIKQCRPKSHCLFRAKKNHIFAWQRIVVLPVDKNNQQWLEAHNVLNIIFVFYWVALIIYLLFEQYVPDIIIWLWLISKENRQKSSLSQNLILVGKTANQIRTLKMY